MNTMESILKNADFKTVGRYTLKGFNFNGRFVIAFLGVKPYDRDLHEEITDENDLPKDGEGLVSYTTHELGVLVDALPRGKEKQYLTTVHAAARDLEYAQAGLVGIFNQVSRNTADIAEALEQIAETYQSARACLASLYAHPRPPQNV